MAHTKGCVGLRLLVYLSNRVYLIHFILSIMGQAPIDLRIAPLPTGQSAHASSKDVILLITERRSLQQLHVKVN